MARIICLLAILQTPAGPGWAPLSASWQVPECGHQIPMMMDRFDYKVLLSIEIEALQTDLGMLNVELGRRRVSVREL